MLSELIKNGDLFDIFSHCLSTQKTSTNLIDNKSSDRTKRANRIIYSVIRTEIALYFQFQYSKLPNDFIALYSTLPKRVR